MSILDERHRDSKLGLQAHLSLTLSDVWVLNSRGRNCFCSLATKSTRLRATSLSFQNPKTMSSFTPPISVAIIGAGIAGMTMAIALSKYNPNLKVTIFESRAAFSEIGAGVGKYCFKSFHSLFNLTDHVTGFGPNAVQAMNLISPDITAAFDNVKSASAFLEKDHVWYDIRHGDGPRAGDFIAEMSTSKGFRHCGASRAQFLDELVKLIPREVEIAFGKKVVDVMEAEQCGKLVILFDDGTSVHADAAIGCDGIRSACRRILLGPEDKSANAVYSGKYAYRKVVGMNKAVEAGGPEMETRQIYVGRGGHLLMFPINNGKLLNVVAFKDAEGTPWTQKQWVIPSSREDLLNDFKGWGEKATKILELIDNPEKWALFDHLPAPTYAKGTLCVVGDAAHATTPHSGAGAGFAIEDVHLLSGLLTPDLINSGSDIKYAFKAYDEMRRPRSQEMVTRSRTNGLLMDLQREDGLEVMDEMLKQSLASNMKWVWEVDLEPMLEEAHFLFMKYKRMRT